MMDGIKAITKYQTEDGVEHTSKAFARQHLVSQTLIQSLESRGINEAYRVLNAICNGEVRDQVLAFFDANEKLADVTMGRAEDA